VLATLSGAQRLGKSAHTMAPWGHLALPRSDGDELEVTSVPAQRPVDWLAYWALAPPDAGHGTPWGHGQQGRLSQLLGRCQPA
jgi:hypothetical protein